MKKLNYVLIAFLLLLLSSCNIFSPVPSEIKNKYVLNTLPNVNFKKSRRNITLLVNDPTTNVYYNTKQIAYSTAPYQIAYFAKNSWVSRPADMIQPLIIQSLTNTHHFHAVISSSASGRYDYLLNTDIEELLQDYTHQMPLVRLTVKAEIVRASNQKIIATKQFVIIQPIPQRSPYGGVYASNQATSRMLQELTQFCLKTI